MKNTILTTTLFAAFTAAPVFADTPPPANALPLSEIIAVVEQSDDIQYIDQIDWDDDGYWEVEYYTADGRSVDVDIDPLTGAPLVR